MPTYDNYIKIISITILCYMKNSFHNKLIIVA